MNDILNPYIAGAPVVETSMFFGREDVFSWIERSLVGKYVGHILVLHGQRRVGKTSVLKQIPNYLPDKYVQVFFDLQGRTGTTLDRFLWWVASEIVRTLKKEHNIVLPKPDRKTFADTEYLISEFLPGLRPILGEKTLLLTFDEFDTLDQSEIQESLAKPLIVYLRRLIEMDDLNFIFSIGSSGDKLENMQASYTDFFKSALYRKISFLTRDDCERLITKPVEGVIKYEKKAIDQIARISSGHPYFAQLICHELFSRCQKTGSRDISLKDVEAVLQDVIERGTVNLKFVWDEASDLEKWILAALAQMDGGSNQKLAKVLTEHKVRFSDSDLNSAVIHLQDKDVISNDNRFVIHLMRMWLVANRPMDRVREELVEVNPIANRYVEIGDEYRDRGQDQLAIESYQQALKADVRNLKAQSCIAVIYLEQKNYTEAVIAFEEALKIDDEDVVSRTGYCDANLALGDEAQNRGETELAIHLYEAILVVNPAHMDARKRMAAIYQEKAEALLAAGRDDEALSAFKQAIMSTPEDEQLSARYEEVLAEKKAKIINAWLRKAEKALSRQRWDEAVEMVEEAVRVDPDDQKLQAKLIEVTDAPRQYKLKEYRREGEQAVSRGNWEKAILAVESATQLAPEDKSLSVWLDTIRKDQLDAQLEIFAQQAEKAIAAGDWEKAILAVESAIQLSPEDTSLSDWLDTIRKDQLDAQLELFTQQTEKAISAGDWDTAVQAVRNAIQLAPEDKKWQVQLDGIESAQHKAKLNSLRVQADEARQNNRWDEAIRALEAYLALEDSLNVRVEIERIQKEKREYESAAFKAQAESAAKAERWQEAIQAWESFLALESGDRVEVEEQLNYARKYARIAGDYIEAQKSIREKRYGRAVEVLQGIIAQDPTYKSTTRLLVEAVEANKAIPFWRKPVMFWAAVAVAVAVVVILLGIFLGPKLWKTAASALEATPGTVETLVMEDEKLIVSTSAAEDEESIEPTMAAAETTILVTSAEDSGEGTLRQALLDAETGEVIRFDTQVFPPGSPTTIFITSETLPRISKGSITIDASNAGVILDGSKLPGTEVGYSGLVLSSDHNIVMGLQIIQIEGSGIYLEDSSFNQIGGERNIGTGPLGQGNLLSDNYVGIGVLSMSAGNVIKGNLIGTDVSGTDTMGNWFTGIWFENNQNYKSAANIVGPDNVIAYNGPTESIEDGQISGGIVMYTVQTPITITANAIYDNIGPGIVHNISAAERESSSLGDAPEIIYFDLDSGAVIGHTCEACFVEIFSTDTQDGKIYEGTVAADHQGNFSFSAGRNLNGPYLTATARSSAEITSAFSQPTNATSDIQIALDAIQSEEPYYQTSFDTFDLDNTQKNISVESGRLILNSDGQNDVDVNISNFSSDIFAIEFEFHSLGLGEGGENWCVFGANDDAEEEAFRALSFGFESTGYLNLQHYEHPDFFADIVLLESTNDFSKTNTIALIILGDQIAVFIDGNLAYTVLNPEGSTVYSHQSFMASPTANCEFDNYKFWDLSSLDFEALAAASEFDFDTANQIVMETIQSEEPLFQSSFDSWDLGDFGELGEGAKLENGKLIASGEGQSKFINLIHYETDMFAVEFDLKFLTSGMNGICILGIGNNYDVIDNKRILNAGFNVSGEVFLGHFVPPDSHPFLIKGEYDKKVTNSIKLIVLGDKISTFVNGQMVYSIVNPDGSSVYSDQHFEVDNTITCEFDNYKFWDLSEVDFSDVGIAPPLDPAIQLALDAIQNEAPLFQNTFETWDFEEPEDNSRLLADGKLIITNEDLESFPSVNLSDLYNFSSDRFVVEYDLRIFGSDSTGFCQSVFGNYKDGIGEHTKTLNAGIRYSGEAFLQNYPDTNNGDYITSVKDKFDLSISNTLMLVVLEDQITGFINGKLVFNELDPDGSTVYTDQYLVSVGLIGCEYDNYKFWDLSDLGITQ
ncbi:MAG: tetratricopeptide repeat protein [Anaerolineaceae bacterium]|nr:tetratricopeptide repeat protein [Anaerolineaceae bacterium]